MNAVTATAPTIDRIKSHNAEAGNYFFSRHTMKCFGSKVLPTVNTGDGGIYFVTSEDNYNRTRRQFNVRKYNPETGDVRTAYTTGRAYGTESYSTPQEARQEAKRLAKEGEPAPIELTDEQRATLRAYSQFPKAPGNEQAAHLCLGGKFAKYSAMLAHHQGKEEVMVYESAAPLNFIWI